MYWGVGIDVVATIYMHIEPLTGKITTKFRWLYSPPRE